jgi:hypothetical protein
VLGSDRAVHVATKTCVSRVFDLNTHGLPQMPGVQVYHGALTGGGETANNDSRRRTAPPGFDPAGLCDYFDYPIMRLKVAEGRITISVFAASV